MMPIFNFEFVNNEGESWTVEFHARTLSHAWSRVGEFVSFRADHNITTVKYIGEVQ
jgi:hypothetical protein